MLDENNRNLMLIVDDINSSNIIKFILKKINKKYEEIFSDINEGNKDKLEEIVYEQINQIKNLLKAEKILILKNAYELYPYLKQLFKKDYIEIDDKNYIKIANDFHLVNNNLKIFVLVNRNEIENLKYDNAFIDIFEKHYINYDMFLEEKKYRIS